MLLSTLQHRTVPPQQRTIRSQVRRVLLCFIPVNLVTIKEADVTITLILWMRKLRDREIKNLSKDTQLENSS